MLKRAAVVGSFFVLAGIAGSCGAQPSVLIQGDYPNITITPDTVRAHRGNTIRWSNRSNARVVLVFQRSPVSPATLAVDERGEGTATVNPEAAYGVYKYDAILQFGAQADTIDPYIDVEEEGR